MEKDDISQVKSKRDVLNERLKAKYPDKDFSDDEAFYGQINDDFDAQGKELDGYKEREKAFTDMFTSDPRSASFITDWRKGEDPTIGLIRRFGSDIKDAIDNPEMQEQIAAANKEYVDRITKSKQLEDEYDKNISETLAYLDNLAKDGKMQESDIDDAMEFLIKIVHDGIVGKFSPETIDMAMKAIKHDTDVEEAENAGEVRGRNTKIDEKLRQGKKGDGTARLDGQNRNGGAQRQMPHLGALDKYEDGNQNIWERGGEKRTRVPRD
jgi:hypothetical protein